MPLDYSLRDPSKETERKLSVVKAKDLIPGFIEFCNQPDEAEEKSQSNDDDSVENEFWNDFNTEPEQSKHIEYVIRI